MALLIYSVNYSTADRGVPVCHCVCCNCKVCKRHEVTCCERVPGCAVPKERLPLQRVRLAAEAPTLHLHTVIQIVLVG